MSNIENDFNKIVEIREVDTLLESLLFLTKYHKRPSSAESLLAGLAVHNSLMTPQMFKKSAKSLGLIVKAVNCSIENLSNLALPAVALFDTNKACVVLNINLKEKKVLLIDPMVSLGEIVISIEEFNKSFKGHLLIIKPAYNFENRVQQDVVIEEPKRWFWRTMKKNIHIYKLVILSAILINLFVIAIPLFGP